MTRAARWLPLILICCALVVSSSGQQQPTPDTQTPVKIQTNEVLLDVVVHDKKGRPVRDLKPEDIEVYEDGIKQTPSKFTLVGDAPANSAKSGSPVENDFATNSTTQLNLVTLLIDHLTAQRVQQVRDAAYNFIDNSLADNVLVRVMVVGRRLYVIEQFTNDRAKLKKAVERATSTVEKSFVEISNRIATELQPIASENSPLAAISESLHTQPSPEAQLAKLTLDTLSASEKLSNEVKSNLHVFSLLPFARAHRLMPGRKMALYFSDGMYMPTGMNEALRSVVSEANRANLTFYAINLRNLPVGAGSQSSRLETATVINATRKPETSTFNSAVGDSFSTSDRIPGRLQNNTNFNVFEYVDRNKELNKRGPLADLTENTGGFLLANINDLNGTLRRVAVDLGHYYSISYVPTKQEYDGKYRTISVKLKRSGIKAQTRNGYFALPPSVNKRPELSYEAPLLAALNDAVVPRDFQFQAGTLHFESRQNEVHTAVLIAAPLSHFTQQEEKDKKSYPIKFAMLGMVKDEKGEVIQRFSEPYELSIPAANLESVKQSVFTMVRHFWLSPGRYTLETAARDQSSGKISAQRQAFTVSLPKSDLQTSSLFLVKQIEQIDVNTNNDPENPLLTGDKRIIPDLAVNIAVANRQELSLNLAIFPKPESTEKPALNLELLLDDKVIAKTSAELPPPDETGKINFTAGIPAANLVPGAYRFHAVVTQAGATAEETMEFTVTGERPKETVIEEKTITSSLAASDKVGELTLVALKAFKPIELSPQDLLQEVEKSGSQIYNRLGDYTYSLRKVRRVLNAKGKIKSEDFQDYEAYPVKGKHALIQFAENGSRLAVTQIDINRKHATDELLKGEQENRNPESTENDNLEPGKRQNVGYWAASLEGAIQKRGQPRHHSFITIDPEEIFKACEFSSPRIVWLENRETIVMNFRPRPAIKLGQDREWIQRLTGTVWIDAAERSLARIEGQRLSVAKEEEEADVPLNFIYQQQRLAAGIWAPSLIRINAAGDENLFRGLNWDAWFEFTNFKRFDASESDVKLNTPTDKKGNF